MTILITRRDYETLPEGAPYELFDGILVKQPSPRFGHQRVQSKIVACLHALLGPARAIPGPVDVLVDELNVFVPDIVVLDEIPDDEAQYVGTPVAVFEILSPSTRERDRSHKTTRLLGLGVREVWLVDRLERSIEVVTVDGAARSTGSERARSEVIGGFALIPDELFGPAGAAGPPTG